MLNCWPRSQLLWPDRIFRFLKFSEVKNGTINHECCFKPGGPKSKIPRHGCLFPVNKCGNFIGRITASLRASLADSSPATSSHLMLGFSTMIASFNLLSIFFFSGSSSSSELSDPDVGKYQNKRSKKLFQNNLYPCCPS